MKFTIILWLNSRGQCNKVSLRACLDPMNWNQYLESSSHFIIRLLSNSSQFLGTKHGLMLKLARNKAFPVEWYRLYPIIACHMYFFMNLSIPLTFRSEESLNEVVAVNTFICVQLIYKRASLYQIIYFELIAWLSCLEFGYTLVVIFWIIVQILYSNLLVQISNNINFFLSPSNSNHSDFFLLYPFS